MATDERTARALTERLIAHARRNGSASATGTVTAVAAAFHLMSAELAIWMGSVGCHALLTQALRKAQADHPALSVVGVVSESHPRLDRLTEAVEARGAKEIAAGLEAALVALFGLLGRLIGDDLATVLGEKSMTTDEPDDRASRP